MKHTISNSFTKRGLAALFCIITLFSCNKDLPQPTPIANSAATGTTLGELISTNPEYSFFKAAATRVGILPLLMDRNSRFTIFLPDNAAFIASGIPSEDVIGALPITTVGGIVSYHILPGEEFTSDKIPETFPNIQLPSFITLGTLPGTAIPFKMSFFPSKRGSNLWLNNIPFTSADTKAANGVIHTVAAIVAPPTQVLRDALYSKPNLTYFKAAVERADSGQVGLSRFDSLLNYAVTNMTVLAPDDAAFQTLLFGSIYGALVAMGVPPVTAAGQATALSSSPAVFSNPLLYGVLTAAMVRGIIAYHFFATPNPKTSAFEPNIRVFSVNFSATPSFVTTLVNSSFASHPGIMVNATFTGPIVTDLKFTGRGTFPPGGAPYTGTPANATSLDNHAVNGVFYIVDEVLLPQ